MRREGCRARDSQARLRDLVNTIQGTYAIAVISKQIRELVAYGGALLTAATDLTQGQDVTPWPRRRVLVSLAPGTVFLLLFIVRARSPFDGRFTLFDDAMVSMAYGRTLVETGEWVWFPGAERVQGFTNPLWTLYMGFLHMLGLHGSSAALAVSITGAVALLMTAAVVFDILWKCLPNGALRDWTPVVAATSIPFLFPLTFWALRGMEVSVLALLSVLLIRAASDVLRSWQVGSGSIRNLVSFSLIAAIGVLTRLDFLLLVGAIFALLLLWAPSFTSRLRAVQVVVLPIAGISLFILAFQHFYFGDYLTNTYRLKMEGFSLADRFRRGLHASAKSLPLTFLTGISAVFLALQRDRSVSTRVGIMFASLWFTCLAYSIWVGGDAWEWSRFDNRYLAVALPSAMAACLLALGQAPVSNRWRLSFVALLLVGVSLAGLGHAVGTNPFSTDLAIGTRSAIAIAAASILLFLAMLLVKRQPASSKRTLLSLASGALLVLTSTSFCGIWSWLGSGGFHVADDAAMTDLVLHLNRASEDAVTATVWAGSPGYYLEGQIIDLLGKSDRTIAESEPASWPLYPGHNKWNYEYSIGELRPDIVIDLWTPTKRDLNNMEAWGYSTFCWPSVPFKSYQLTESAQIDDDQLPACAG